ncbi:MAG: radical SAM protein [Candidatus Latescibacteria bacterium]|nr:radical SAM protein [Candidatus Latescibacterota bacterium]
MAITEITAKSLLRKFKKIDSWFVARYGMNLYRGCTHNCLYCDGRAEGYYVEGEFGRDVAVKVNAAELLRKELNPLRKRKPMRPGFMLIGGGVGDSYQPAEEQYGLTRKILEVVYEFDFPVHVLTKSTLVRRDIDILKKIDGKSRAMVSFSFSSADDRISKVFEPGVPPPSERLRNIAFLKDQGISCGMFLMPVLPYVTDTRELMEETVVKAKEAGVDFIIFSGLTLKEGRQKQYFYEALKTYDPGLVPEYDKLYTGNTWGQASGTYYDEINKTFRDVTDKYAIPKRIPPELYRDFLDQNDLVVVMLEHMDYLLTLRGEKSPFGFAAYSISKVKEPLSSKKSELTGLKGVGNYTEKIILEILDTGNSILYQKLMGR